MRHTPAGPVSRFAVKNFAPTRSAVSRALVALTATAAALTFAAAISGPAPVQAAPDDVQLKFYTEKVVPIFQANCYRCHGGMNHRGGFTMDTRAGMAKGGHDGIVLVPGDPDKSLIVKLIRHEGPANDPMPMPPNKPKISDDDIATITQWVKAGALMPEDTPKP